MNCPYCASLTQPGDLVCPHCGEALLTLAPGTRLYQRFQMIRALRRDEGGIAYQALDESRQEQVLLLEFFPVGTRRLGTLALLPEDTRPVLTRWVGHLSTRGRAAGAGQPVQVDFEQNGTHYAVTALPLGTTLRQRVNSGRPLDGQEAQVVLLALAQELQRRHARAVIDGEISPERVSLVAGTARLDLGWGRVTWPAALAPEQQLTPAKVIPASDIYALGAVFLYAVTGQPIPEAAARALGQPLPSLPPDTPAPLRRAIELSLALPAAERPDAAALVRLLSQSERTPTKASSGSLRPEVKIIQAHQGWLTHLSLSPDYVATAGTDLRTRLFDLSGQPLQTLDGLEGQPVGLHFSDMGLVAGDQSGRVVRWEGRHIRSGHAPHRLRALAVRPGENAVTLQDDGSLGAWDLAGPARQGVVKVPGALGAVLHVSADDVILLGTQRGQLLALDEQTLIPDVWWTHAGAAPITAFASTVDQVAVATGREIFKLSGTEETALPLLPHPVSALAFSPDGTELVVGDSKGQLHLLSLTSGGVTCLHQGKSPIRAVAWGEMMTAGNELGQLLFVRRPVSA